METISISNDDDAEIILSKLENIMIEDYPGIFVKKFSIGNNKHFVIVPASPKGKKKNITFLLFLKNIGIGINWKDRRMIRGNIIHADNNDVEYYKNAPSGWYVV